ncbi:MAG: hypothetical protein ACYC2U_07910, partial [Candidatus Amoebophilus sp.]
SLLSMGLILQSHGGCGGRQAIQTTTPPTNVSPVKTSPESKQITQSTSGSSIYFSSSDSEKVMVLIGKREREEKEEEKQELRLLCPKAKRGKPSNLEGENESSEYMEEISAIVDSSYQGELRDQTMDLITFFKAIRENEEAKRKILKQREEEEKDEVLTNIFQYLPIRSILNLTEANTDLYKFFNDCQEIGLVGVENIKKSTCFNPYSSRVYCYSNFNKVKYSLENIPSIPFCRIMQQVSNLPRTYWPYIAKTNISAIILASKGMQNIDFIDLWKCLQGSKVHEINLSYNEITDEVVTEIAKLPLPASLSKVNLEYNELTEAGKTILQSTYPNITWVF